MLRIQGLIPLVAAVATFLLAIFVSWRAPNRTLGRVFGILAVVLAFWNLNIFALYAFHDYEDALNYSRIFRTGAVFLLPAILHLSLVLPQRQLAPRWRAVLIVDYLWSALLAGLNLAGLLVTKLAAFDWGFYSIGGFYYNLFTASLIFNFTLSAWLLASEYRTTGEPHMRLQLKLWLVGMAIALPLGITNLLPAYGIRLYPLGNLGSAIWAGVVGYAIVRYRLMDIEIVVARSISYFAVALLCIGPIGFIVWFLQRRAFGEGHYDFTVALCVLFLVVALTFSRLQEWIERRLERSLFPGKVESHAVLANLANQAVRELDPDRLIDLVCEQVSAALGLDRVALYLRDDARGGFEVRKAVGAPPSRSHLASGDSLVRWASTRGEPVLRDEAADAKVGSAEAAAILRGERWEALVPLMVGREVLGVLFLGRKLALEPYSVRDLNLLGVVAIEVGVALQNARLYDELRKSREIINRAGRLSALGTLAAGIAHEIRNPLVSIQTFFQLAPERLGDEEFMTSFLRLAEAEVKRISSLIAELLTFAKSPSPSLRTLDLNEISERSIILLEPQARAQGVKLVTHLSHQLGKVLGDADQIMQVVLNLALNAIQATPKGGTVTLSTCSAGDAKGDMVQLVVADTGSGISPEHLDNIFDPFFTTKEKGTGLGLSIAHQIISEAGGFLSVESRVNAGSRFTMNLPLSTEDDTPEHRGEARYL